MSYNFFSDKQFYDGGKKYWSVMSKNYMGKKRNEINLPGT